MSGEEEAYYTGLHRYLQDNDVDKVTFAEPLEVDWFLFNPSC